MPVLRQALLLAFAFATLAALGRLQAAASIFPYIWIATCFVYRAPIAAIAVLIAHGLVLTVALAGSGLSFAGDNILNLYYEIPPPLSAVLLCVWYAPVIFIFSSLEVDEVFHSGPVRRTARMFGVWPVIATAGSLIVYRDRLRRRYQTILAGLRMRGWEPGPLSPLFLAHRWLPILVSSLVVEVIEQHAQNALRPVRLQAWVPIQRVTRDSSGAFNEAVWALAAGALVFGLSS